MERKRADLKTGQGGSNTVFILLPILFLCIALVAGADPEYEEASSQKVWNFDSEPAGTLPPGFLVGTLVDGRPAGKWQVIDMKTSLNLLGKLDRSDHARISKLLQGKDPPSAPHVFAQLKSGGYFTDYNVVLVGETTVTDFDLQVSLLPIAGKADMGGGLIWRAQDHQNYYIARANPLEQNIRIYRVVNGVRYKLKNFNHIISVKTWHTLLVVARGSRFQVFFDEQPVLDVRDETFQAGGKIGLWTKADAVTYFDDLQLSTVK
ncbi:hypothetical protein [Nitrospina gracilis]|uniref:hypothetical protein n=1 Tax=Nitrospina gracilis TaxID=35801 RepID=UPI001F205A3A|nr:hypothetical protein [Nitrospina gracilis]MCF8719578.1 hypothetical protein [Nitrospina gracilis Nb-211]